MQNELFDLKLLGPLYPLIGKWRGSKGRNVAPDTDREIEDTIFTEEFSFTPIQIVENHEQILYGLNYERKAFENGDELFHEEYGHWLWNPVAKEVYRLFVIPRGVTVLSGGKASDNASSFRLEANLGDKIFGIASIPFLDKEFQTVKYTVDININAQEFSYKEITFLKMPGRKELFEHLEENTLSKID